MQKMLNPILNRLFTICPLLLCCIALPVKAQQTVAPTLQASAQGQTRAERAAIIKLNQLVKQEQYAEAYAFAQQVMFDYGGEPSFDFLTGRAALKVNQFQQAVFAFERAVIVKPEWQQARVNPLLIGDKSLAGASKG